MSMQSQSPEAVVIDYVFPVLAVVDLDAAVAYYADALGFHVTWRWGEPPVRAGVARDAVEFQLVGAGTPGAPLGPAVVYCHMRGVAAYYAACLAYGANIIAPLTTHPFGLSDFRISDLDGNILGFGEPIALESPPGAP
jgi:catechol 2,3-dioxygenase-like lactoylglutathione lyase family enzyme